MLLSLNLLNAVQPNFVYCKTNKIGIAPKRVNQNKFAFFLPRKLILKSKKPQLVFLNVSCAFPFGANTIFREAMELRQNKNIQVEIINVQDGSSFVSNFLIKLTNSSRFNVTLKRGMAIITVKIFAIRELTPIRVKRIDYNTENCDVNGSIVITYE
jgi:hypothetical protein